MEINKKLIKMKLLNMKIDINKLNILMEEQLSNIHPILRNYKNNNYNDNYCNL